MPTCMIADGNSSSARASVVALGVEVLSIELVVVSKKEVVVVVDVVEGWVPETVELVAIDDDVNAVDDVEVVIASDVVV